MAGLPGTGSCSLFLPSIGKPDFLSLGWCQPKSSRGSIRLLRLRGKLRLFTFQVVRFPTCSSLHPYQHPRIFTYKPHPSFLSSPRFLPNYNLPLSRLSSPLPFNPTPRWLTGTPQQRLRLTMVRLQLHRSLGSPLIRSRHSCIHQVYARLIRALPVITVPVMHLSHSLIRSRSTAGSLHCPSISTGSSSLEERSFVGPWYVLW